MGDPSCDVDFLLKVIGKQQVLIERLVAKVKAYERHRVDADAQAHPATSESPTPAG